MTLDAQFLRGSVWQYEFELGAPPKPALIVSNNGRNRTTWPVVHVVRLTTAPKALRDTIVVLESYETLKGSVLCDDLQAIYKEDLGQQMGFLTPGTMRQVDQALKRVLALP